MKRITIAISMGLALAAALPTASANAQNARSFVSGQGSDSNSCTLAAPCRTFAFAITRTNAGGEILTLNPAGYGPVTIDKSISIVSSPGAAGVNILTAGTAITINALSTDVVSLRGLTIDGLGIGTTGIVFNSGKSLTIDHSVVRNFKSSGIAVAPSANVNIVVSNTVVSNNGGHGIYVQPSGTDLKVRAVFNRVEVYNNAQVGIGIYGNLTLGVSYVSAIAVDCVSAHNTTGYYVVGNGISFPIVAVLRVFRSTAFDNNTGVVAENFGYAAASESNLEDNIGQNWSILGGGKVVSYGDNYTEGVSPPIVTNINKQ